MVLMNNDGRLKGCACLEPSTTEIDRELVALIDDTAQRPRPTSQGHVHSDRDPKGFSGTNTSSP